MLSVKAAGTDPTSGAKVEVDLKDVATQTNRLQNDEYQLQLCSEFLQLLIPRTYPNTQTTNAAMSSSATSPKQFNINRLRCSSSPNSISSQSSDDDGNSDEKPSCPLCTETLDPTEMAFKPCPCGYQVCAILFEFNCS